MSIGEGITPLLNPDEIEITKAAFWFDLDPLISSRTGD